MKLTKLGKIVVALGAACIILAGWKAFDAYKHEKAIENRTYKTVEHVKLSEEKEQEIKMNYTDESTVIDIVHEQFNKMLGWGSYTYFDDEEKWKNEKENLKFIYEIVERAKNDATINENMRKDFGNVLKLINKAVENRDVDGLIYAHRIIHDLDHEINSHEAPDIQVFGYSIYCNGDETKEVYDYLKEN
jgi:hypothetical protein